MFVVPSVATFIKFGLVFYALGIGFAFLFCVCVFVFGLLYKPHSNDVNHED